MLLRYSGLAAVAVLWATLGAAALAGGFPLLGERPLSWLVEHPASSILYTVGLAAGALFLVAFHDHVRRQYRVGRGFSVSMLVGLAGQLVAAVVPINGDATAHRVHTVAALALGASLPVLMWRFAAAQPPGHWRAVARRLSLAEAAACAVGVVLSRNSVAPLAEILPAFVFHVWIAVLTLSGDQYRAAGRGSGDEDGAAVGALGGDPMGYRLRCEEGGVRAGDCDPGSGGACVGADAGGGHAPRAGRPRSDDVRGLDGKGDAGAHRLLGRSGDGRRRRMFRHEPLPDGWRFGSGYFPAEGEPELDGVSGN